MRGGKMSRSNANALLQYLVAELTKLWRGEKSEIKTAEQAYEICAEIVKEAEEQCERYFSEASE